MELRAWRERTPFGAYLQPIHLKIDADTSSSAKPTAASKSTAKKGAIAPTDSHSEPLATNGNANRASPSDVTDPVIATDDDVVLVIPPFESARIENNRSASMVINAGGPVWALDWLPQHAPRRRRQPSPSTSAPSTQTNSAAAMPANGNGDSNDESSVATSAWQFLALSTHPPCEVVDNVLVKRTPPDHYYSVETSSSSARGLVQIWAIPIGEIDGDATAARKPVLVFGIDHTSGVVWDVQWCPLADVGRDLLGVLGVCFGDGSVQVFHVPAVAAATIDRVAAAADASAATCVETLVPTLHARIPNILQLSLQWSLHHAHQLLTGGSDGSVSLWNFEDELQASAVATITRDDTAAAADALLLIEPQRRFQDVDTVGKQEPFDWGWGWVAVRAVAWSPFDEFLFATTGNDSVFKIWDIREPRICLRSHRIRSTWGLALQWMDHTTLQISGDQGSIYMYDILSGSYQKLHSHPQVDSPVWDLQFARRRSNVPLLASCCTSGSIRIAPAKKLFRAAQHSVELFRLRGDPNASVDVPFKALRASFAHRVVSTTAETANPATRAFCERDAALHRLRVSPSASASAASDAAANASTPCLLAAGGHAGLVVVLEIQAALDQLIDDYCLPANKTLGRPRKGSALWLAMMKMRAQNDGGGNNKKSKGATAAKKPPKRPQRIHIKPKKMHNALAKYKTIATPRGKKKATATTTKQQTPLVVSDNEDATATPAFAEVSEAEYDGSSSSESDASSSLSSAILVDNPSDDDVAHASVSDGDSSDTALLDPQGGGAQTMLTKYQLDLSEDDALLLAIQMSEMEQATPQPQLQPQQQPQPQQQQRTSNNKASGGKAATKATKRNNTTTKKKQVGATTSAVASLTHDSDALPTESSALEATTAATQEGEASERPHQPTAPASKPKTKAPAKRIPQAKPPITKTSSTNSSKSSDKYIVDQRTTLQLIQLQNGLTEEDALMEAIRMSQVEAQQQQQQRSQATATRRPPANKRGRTNEPTATKRVAAASSTRPRAGASAKTAATPPVDSTIDASREAATTSFISPAASFSAVPAVADAIEVAARAVDNVMPAAAAACMPSLPPATASVDSSTSTTMTTAPPVGTKAKAKAKAKTLKPRVTAPTGSKKTKAAVATAAPTEYGAEPAEFVADTHNADAIAIAGATTATSATAAAAAGDDCGDDVAAVAMPKERLPAATKPAAAKRKRAPATVKQSRKRPAKASTTTATSSTNKPSTADRTADVATGSSKHICDEGHDAQQQQLQVASGYLTDEEALYMAIRASEIEY